jgi:tyrosine-protein phosphatase non-receptor type 1
MSTVYFQRIRNESNNYDYAFDASKKHENKNLNRYRDVNPYDHSRVVLVKGTTDQDKQRSDYINASLVRVM